MVSASGPDTMYGLDGIRPSAAAMKRQDSGYESLPALSSSSTSSRRRDSDSSSKHRPRLRQCARRASRASTHSNYVSRTNSQSLYSTRSQPPLPTCSFPFPPQRHHTSPAPLDTDESEVSRPLPPPPTTHYWTSDKTRKLEYAAIDAASQGLKGWVKRNLMPECIAPKNGGHIGFDDDTGSVRRYRLDLEDGDDIRCEKDCLDGADGKKKSWLTWGRKSSV